MSALGIGELGAAAINAGLSYAQSEQQFEYDKELAKMQNQFNIDMWNRQNAYNTPAAQMQRFIDAGLSPNLIYGQGTAGNATSAPEQIAPRHIAPDLAKFHNVDLLGGALSLLSASQDLKAKILNNIDKASEIEGRAIAGSLSQPDADVTVSRKMPFRLRLQNWFKPFTPSGLRAYYAYRENDLMKYPEVRNEVLSGNKDLTKSRKVYQNLINDWFKADRIFGYVNNGLRTVSSFIPKAHLNLTPSKSSYQYKRPYSQPDYSELPF